MNKRVWLITGVSSGLGKALAEQVISNGDYVIGTFRQQDQKEAFDRKYGSSAKGILLDITDLDTIDDVIETTILDVGTIDILVNNAGVGFAGAIEEASIEEVRNVFEANFFGTLKMTQALLPHMREKRNGQIVQISSHAGIKAFSGFGIYNASKFALEGFSEALAQEVAPLGIKVHLIEPGPFRTKFAGQSLHQAKLHISDYASTAGAFRKKLLDAHGQQEGDPQKAALCIIDHLDSEDSSLRLALGRIPLTTIGMKIDQLRSDLEKNKEVSIKAVF